MIKKLKIYVLAYTYPESSTIGIIATFPESDKLIADDILDKLSNGIDMKEFSIIESFILVKDDGD